MITFSTGRIRNPLRHSSCALESARCGERVIGPLFVPLRFCMSPRISEFQRDAVSLCRLWDIGASFYKSQPCFMLINSLNISESKVLFTFRAPSVHLTIHPSISLSGCEGKMCEKCWQLGNLRGYIKKHDIIIIIGQEVLMDGFHHWLMR